MPDLHHTFLKHDLGHLNIIADFWGLELESHTADAAADELSASILKPEPVRETLEILSPDARSAIHALIESTGKIEWVIFTRKYGTIQEMGIAKRERERPFQNPTSVTEGLFYRGLIDKAFFETENGAQEFAFIPDDLFEVIRQVIKDEKKEETRKNLSEPLGRLAISVEKAFELPADDSILDDATTLLAAIRMGQDQINVKRDLYELLSSAKIIKKNTFQTEETKNFLGISRAEALNLLYTSWTASKTFNELRLLPNILCEGEWKNDAYNTRQFLLNLIHDLPKDKWWSIPAFVRDIKEKTPDFQRPAGDYDSWFIKRISDGQYLRGFAHWDEIDGALIKYYISLLHYLGQVDLASPQAGKEAAAFRIKHFKQTKKETGKITVSSNGKIIIPQLLSRAIRYQVARFCEWDDKKGDDYVYRVTARSLKHANEQRLKAEQLLSLLVKHTSGSVPPPLVKALKRWDAQGSEAHLETQTILKLSKPEMLVELRKSKAARFLGDVLNPTTVVIKSGAQDKVLAALAELGLFAEIL